MLNTTLKLAKLPTQVACPYCQTTVVWCNESLYRPFCSERCKAIDFGAWTNESIRITHPEMHFDFDNGAN
ncbi:MAG: DNA gyrase inhibitor YacG [Neisseriaceae bacterium]|nr:DNA gyrase inhibitor YacG [Neisseriaceae bacterium]